MMVSHFDQAGLSRRKLAIGLGIIVTLVVLVFTLFALTGDDDDGSTASSSSTTTSSVRITQADAEAIVEDYLAAISSGDYQSAANLLVAGDEALSQRDDLAELQLDTLSGESVAVALESYCGSGCIDHTGIQASDEAQDGAYNVTGEFGEPRGHPRQRSFVAGQTPDGTPYVRGLPPNDDGVI